jgi:hypothetical protein
MGMDLFPLNPAELQMRLRGNQELQDMRAVRAYQAARMATAEVQRQSEELDPSEDEDQRVSA